MSEATSTGLHVAGTVLRRAVVCLQDQRAIVGPLEATPFSSVSPSSGMSSSSDRGVCVAALPASDVMTRIWTMPPADKDRLRQMAEHRLGADLPVSLEELVWDARRSVAGDASPVLTQAARRERVAAYVANLTRLGYEVQTLTTEAEALAALCRHGLGITAEQQLEGFLLAGTESWVVFTYGDGVVRSLRRIRMADVSVEAACHQCREFFQDAQPSQLPSRLRVCAANDSEDLRDRLAAQVDMVVETIEADRLERNMVGHDGHPLTYAELVEFAVAIGLGLAGLHRTEAMICLGGRQLDEASRTATSRIEAWLSHPFRWSAVAALTLVLAGGTYLHALHSETRHIKSLQAGFDVQAEPMTALQPKVRAAQRIERYRIQVEEIIAEVCEEIPESMILSSIKLSRRGGLEIKTTKGDSKAGFKLAEALRKQERFSNVQATVAIGKEGFTVTADIEGIESLTGRKGQGAAWR